MSRPYQAGVTGLRRVRAIWLGGVTGVVGGMWCNHPMQSDSVSLDALRPSLERLAAILDEVEFTLPTAGREEAERVRSTVVRTVTEYLLPRLDEPDAPVVAAVIGSSGTGKSTIVNSLANDRISDVGPLRPTTRSPVLWAHRDHGGRYWTEFVARVRERVGPAVEVVIGDDDLTKQLTLIDTPPAEYVAPSGRNPAVDALALADLCVFVTSPTRYADISAWDFLREIRWRGVPMLFVLNRLPPDRDQAIALLNDFAARLHGNGLLLEPDAAMVFGVGEAVGDRWHGGLDPASVGALRNELGSVSNTAYRKTLISMTAFTTGRNVVDRCQLLLRELDEVADVSDTLEAATSDAYSAQVAEMKALLREGKLSDMARHTSWSEAAVDLTAIVTRRAGVAAQETANAWLSQDTGAKLLEGKGTSLWRHTEDTSWDVQGRLEEWEETLAEVVNRHSKGGSRSERSARRMATKVWPAVVDLERTPTWRMRRWFQGRFDAFRTAAQESLGEVIASALEVDANRFRQHLKIDRETADGLRQHVATLFELIDGYSPGREPTVERVDTEGEGAEDA
jgi:hypothetical protein